MTTTMPHQINSQKTDSFFSFLSLEGYIWHLWIFSQPLIILRFCQASIMLLGMQVVMPFLLGIFCDMYVVGILLPTINSC